MIKLPLLCIDIGPSNMNNQFSTYLDMKFTKFIIKFIKKYNIQYSNNNNI
jgi:hypothetical protein